MAARYALGHGLGLLGLSAASIPSSTGLALQTARFITASAGRLWPDVVVPPMGESIKEGSIAAVLKQVGQPVREDEVIAQIETDKVTIDVRAPTAGFVQQLLVKPSDTVVAGQLVAVVGADAAAPAAAAPAAASPTAAAHAGALGASAGHGRAPMIHFPPRTTASGERISALPEEKYTAALSAAEAAARPQAPAAAPEAPPVAAPAAAAAAAVPPPAPSHPVAAARAAPPPVAKNRLQYVTRPDGRGAPPRRPLTERELEMINLGGAS